MGIHVEENVCNGCGIAEEPMSFKGTMTRESGDSEPMAHPA